MNTETLAFYSNLRTIRHWNPDCPHWRGEDSNPYGADHGYEFQDEADALKWFRTGAVPAATQELTPQQIAAGCACRAVLAATTDVPHAAFR